MSETSVCPIIYTKEGSENETIYVIWGSILCIAAPYGSPRGDDLGNPILPRWNGDKFSFRSFMEGDDTCAAMEDKQYPC